MKYLVFYIGSFYKKQYLLQLRTAQQFGKYRDFGFGKYPHYSEKPLLFVIEKKVKIIKCNGNIKYIIISYLNLYVFSFKYYI